MKAKGVFHELSGLSQSSRAFNYDSEYRKEVAHCNQLSSSFFSIISKKDKCLVGTEISEYKKVIVAQHSMENMLKPEMLLKEK